MHRTVKTIGGLAAVALLALSACASPATPTPDANAVYTEAAATVQAALTQNAALTPSATPTTEPTNTPVPPTETPTQAVTPTTAAVTALPVAPTTAVAVSPDRAEFVSQTPEDNTKIDPGANFVVTWTVKNTGTTTWTKAYNLRFYAGSQMGAPAASSFPKEVKPGETVELSLPLVAPSTAGDYMGTWVMTNADGVNFYNMFIQIKVGNAPAATATTAATAAPSAAPTSEPTASPTP